jgi:hypothetical protein
MIYYTIYVKDLNNGMGYIDVALEDDQLLRDFEQYLDIGVRPHRSYKIAPSPGGVQNEHGFFTVDFSSISAVTSIYADKGKGKSRETELRRRHDASAHTRHHTRESSREPR